MPTPAPLSCTPGMEGRAYVGGREGGHTPLLVVAIHTLGLKLSYVFGWGRGGGKYLFPNIPLYVYDPDHIYVGTYIYMVYREWGMSSFIRFFIEISFKFSLSYDKIHSERLSFNELCLSVLCLNILLCVH